MLDLVRLLPVLRRYPRMYMLHTLQYESIGQYSSRLKDLAVTVCLATHGQQFHIEDAIRHLLMTYTNDANSRIDTLRIGGSTFYRFEDRRLPNWAKWYWGTHGELFFLTIARDERPLERILQAKSQRLSSAAWYMGIRMDQAQHAAYVNLQTVRENLVPAARSRFDGVCMALGLADSDRAVFCTEKLDDTFGIRMCHRRQGREVVRILSSPHTYAKEHTDLVPHDSSWHAIVNGSAARLIRTVQESYLSIIRPSQRESLTDSWREFVTSSGADVDVDFLSQLGDTVIVHDYPRHPLHVPLMWTVMVEIDGDAARVAKFLNRTFAYFAMKLDLIAVRSENAVTVPMLQRSDDGIWYLQAGLYGPAVVVTPQWLVISYSPQALRQNLNANSAATIVPRLQSNGTNTNPKETERANHSRRQ